MMPWRPLGIPQEEVDAFVKHFKERARFYLDEDTHEAARYVLEAQGYKVKTARDAGMVRRDDEDHAARWEIFVQQLQSVHSIDAQQDAATRKAEAVFDALLANAFQESRGRLLCT